MIHHLPTPAVIAHRGASACAPENTVSAFNLAVSQKADAIELDVQLSADGKVFVFHDLSANRITSHNGVIRNLKLSKIKKFDVGAHFEHVFQGESIPQLPEVFALDGIPPLNIELKVYGIKPHELVKAVISTIYDYECADKVLISSFNLTHILYSYQVAPELNYALILPSLLGSLLFRTGLIKTLPLVSIHIPFLSVTQRLISKIHSFGMKAFVYTLNSPDKIKYVLEAGADGFFTDNPALGRKTVLDFSGSGAK
jgi:glycerophosphoryl diester phosphodiesterase